MIRKIDGNKALGVKQKIISNFRTNFDKLLYSRAGRALLIIPHNWLEKEELITKHLTTKDTQSKLEEFVHSF